MRPSFISDLFRRTLGLGEGPNPLPADGWTQISDQSSEGPTFQRLYTPMDLGLDKETLLTSIKLSVLNVKHGRGILIEIENRNSSTIILKVLGESHLLKDCCVVTHHINALIDRAEKA